MAYVKNRCIESGSGRLTSDIIEIAEIKTN